VKPKKTIEFVEVTYWACGWPAHRHKTKEVAQSCINKKGAPKRPPRSFPIGVMADAFDSVIDGATLKAAAEKHGLTAGRMSDVFQRVRHIAMRALDKNDPMPDHKGFDAAGLREHSAFWKRQTAKMRANNAAGGE
jgi:hypothetical protein